MPRVARLVVPGLPHHVTQRGNRRQPIFFTDDDRQQYLRWLQAASRRFHVQIWAYCLMTNHVHAIAVPADAAALAYCFRDVHTRFAWHINRRMRWRGHLWQARFGSSVMDERHTIATVRYVEQNPVHARLVTQAWDYPWSSARAHVGLVADDPVLSGESALRAEIGDWRQFLETPTPAALVRTIQAETRSCRPLGDLGFLQQLEAQYGVQLIRGRRGRPRHEK